MDEGQDASDLLAALAATEDASTESRALAGDRKTAEGPVSERELAVLDPEADAGRIIDLACAALEDIDQAADFVDAGGLEQLAQAVDTAAGQVRTGTDRGREAIAAFEAFQAAAAGNHFRHGHDTSLARPGIRRDR